jgi:Condensin II complex subunit CAP-H2 or CNDH2, C-term
VASTIVSFDTVTMNCTQSDVCRLFLASLSLANSGNIRVEEGAPVYTFDLISANVKQPMETYRAPSLAEHD